MTEGSFSLELIKSFQHFYGNKVYIKKKIQNAYTGSGEPDLHVCLNGRAIYIESKLFRYPLQHTTFAKDMKAVTPTQMADLIEIHRAGGAAWLAFNYRPSKACMFIPAPFQDLTKRVLIMMQTGCIWPVNEVF